MVDTSRETIILAINYFLIECKEDTSSFFGYKIYNDMLKSGLKINKKTKYDKATFKRIIDKSKKIDNIVRSKRFSGEMIVWLLISYMRDEKRDIDYRSKFGHIDLLGHISKLEEHYRVEALEHHKMLTEIIKEINYE